MIVSFWNDVLLSGINCGPACVILGLACTIPHCDGALFLELKWRRLICSFIHGGGSCSQLKSSIWDSSDQRFCPHLDLSPCSFVWNWPYFFLPYTITSIYKVFSPCICVLRQYGKNLNTVAMFACVCPRKGGMWLYWMSAAITLKDKFSFLIYSSPSRLYQD